MTNRILKTLNFTDIHWGARNNQELHNQDCLRFVSWVCDKVKQDPSIKALIFLGDWFESRSSINISTLNYSYQGAKILNDLGLPIFFIIGNHDLYHRHTRDVHSVIHFNEFKNFNLIEHPTVIPELGKKGAFLSPFLFPDEYKNLKQYLNYETWWGHFEFKGFVVTGANNKMMTGPDGNDFKGPIDIFCGHFHKRQKQNNISYIGNTFPTNFGDVNDFDRGCMVYDFETNTPVYHNWEDGPKYIKVNVSQLKNQDYNIPPQTYLKCVINIPVTYEDLMTIREQYTEKYNIREFTFEESNSKQESLTSTDNTVDEEILLTETVEDTTTVDEMVVNLLGNIDNNQLDNELLIRIYNSCRTN